jgi:hypothetical protein
MYHRMVRPQRGINDTYPTHFDFKNFITARISLPHAFSYRKEVLIPLNGISVIYLTGVNN